MSLFPDFFFTKENTDCFCYHKVLICSVVREIFWPENKQRKSWKLLLSQSSKIIDIVGKIDCDHHV